MQYVKIVSSFPCCRRHSHTPPPPPPPPHSGGTQYSNDDDGPLKTSDSTWDFRDHFTVFTKEVEKPLTFFTLHKFVKCHQCSVFGYCDKMWTFWFVPYRGAIHVNQYEGANCVIIPDNFCKRDSNSCLLWKIDWKSQREEGGDITCFREVRNVWQKQLRAPVGSTRVQLSHISPVNYVGVGKSHTFPPAPAFHPSSPVPPPLS